MLRVLAVYETQKVQQQWGRRLALAWLGQQILLIFTGYKGGRLNAKNVSELPLAFFEIVQKLSMYLHAYLVLNYFISVCIPSFFKDSLVYLCPHPKKGIHACGVIPCSKLVPHLPKTPVCCSFSLMILR